MYGDLINNMRARRTNVLEKGASLKYELYEQKTGESLPVVYAISAMQPIDPVYTQKSVAEGDRVKNQLEKNVTGRRLGFRYQGSATNNTNILAASDIDLLTIEDKFVMLQRPQVPANRYTGEPIEDLLELRLQAENILRAAYPRATVTITNPMSIPVEGGSLWCKVDVVICNWYDSNRYVEQGRDETYRGVQVLNKADRATVNNFPFLHNALLDYRERQTSGNFKRAVRLLKTLDRDAAEDRRAGVPSGMASYDKCALMYSMPDLLLNVPIDQPTRLVSNIGIWLNYLENDQAKREELMIPLGNRRIFCDEGANITELRALNVLVTRLVNELTNELRKSHRRIDEARLPFLSSL